MPINIGFSVVDDSALIYFDTLPPALRERMNSELVSMTELLYAKVMENLGGKILQQRTGQLSGSIVVRIETETDVATGFVGPEPQTPKALALELGGKGFYDIVPTKARALHFFAKSGEEVYTKYVNHPPSKEYRYLREALAELEPTVEGTWIRAVEEALRP